MAKKTVKKTVSKKTLLADVVTRLDRIEKLLVKDEQNESFVAAEETKELAEIEKLEKLQADIQKEVAPHPLTRITYHDITKGLIGAFFGVVGHFAFFYGQHLAETLSNARAATLYAVSLLLLIMFLYFSGFRRIAEYRKYLPARVAIIYCTALIVATSVLFLFGILHWPVDLHELYVNTAAVAVLAVMGAATADLIGGEA